MVVGGDEGRQAQAAATVLVVDDDAAIRTVFSTALERAGYRALQAASGTEALALVAEQPVDLMLLDLGMPGPSGIDLVATLRGDPRHEELAIVLVSGDGALESKLAALGAGANDYLVKPVPLQELLARVAAQLRDRSRWLRRLDDELAERSRLARRIAELDPTHPLRQLEHELAELLGAELGIVSLRIATPGTVAADTELTVDRAPGGAKVKVPLRFAGVLVGLVEATVEGPPARAVSTLGDLSPHLGAVVADASVREGSTQETRDWVDEMIQSDGIRPVYQPIVDLADGTTVGFEGLSRFADDHRPDVAFERAAQAGVAPQLELAAIERLVAGARQLPADAWLSVNVSAATVATGVLGELLRTAERPMVLELTENEHVDDYAAVRRQLGNMPDVELAVDDAGAGYASLRHVFELRPDVLKLDRGWIRGIDGDPVRQALVHGLIGFSSAFGARIVAEGVEREAESTTLSQLGVPLAQGFLFGRPAPATEQAPGATRAARGR